jgi:hypothetical protein
VLAAKSQAIVWNVQMTGTGGQMEQVSKTIFGDRYRPHRRSCEKDASRGGVVVEKPAYDP